MGLSDGADGHLSVSHRKKEMKKTATGGREKYRGKIKSDKLLLHWMTKKVFK